MTLKFTSAGCEQTWNATCTSVSPKALISISLIPVLDKVDDCKLIHDSLLQEHCRQLNTYRSAFLHLDTPQDLEKGQQLCAEVDHSSVSKTCAAELEVFSRKVQRRPTVLEMPAARLEDTFLDSVGAISRINATIWDNNVATNHVGYAANYGSNGRWPVLTAVVVEDFFDPDRPKTWLSELPEREYEDYHQATIVDETRLGQKIRMYHGPRYTAALWTSGNKVVHISFYAAISEQDQFINKYLEKFPSTL